MNPGDLVGPAYNLLVEADKLIEPYDPEASKDLQQALSLLTQVMIRISRMVGVAPRDKS